MKVICNCPAGEPGHAPHPPLRTEFLFVQISREEERAAMSYAIRSLLRDTMADAARTVKEQRATSTR